MCMNIKFKIDDKTLDVRQYLTLVQRVWTGNYNVEMTGDALLKTINVTAWDNDDLIGCCRVMTDGYYFGTIPEILVDPAYQRQGIGKRLIELAWEVSPTSLFIGVQPGNEGFFEKQGFEKSIQAYQRKKSRKE